jgi:AraC-like DNA-binding protein
LLPAVSRSLIFLLMRSTLFLDGAAPRYPLDKPIDVTTLARMTKRSQFHFSLVFRRSVGASPYRFIVYLRLRRAVELIREDRLGLAHDTVVSRFIRGASDLVAGSGLHFDERGRHLLKGLREPMDLHAVSD